jgi:2-oxoglutarate ferredoxin oxidoreductase subunit beta
MLSVVGGIGCSSKAPYYLKNYGFSSSHGRSLPIAQAIKITNPKLTVIATFGDGDGIAEGGNHFVHACRRNVDMTAIIHNNQIYGLTTGQASPTSEKGFVTVSSPDGTIEIPINICALAITSGTSFVARSFAGDLDHLTEILKKAIKHKGFAVVEVLQPCVTFNKKNTFDWDKEHTYKLDKKYKSNDKIKALEKAFDNKKLALGVLYEEKRKCYEDEIPQIKKQDLIDQETKVRDISKILDNEFS